MTRKFLGYDLTPDLIYLIEALKVEGYWSVKNHECSIQNKNLEFLRKINQILKMHGVNAHKRIYVKVKLPEQDICKDDIILKNGNVDLKFRIEKSPFSESKKVAFMLPYSKRQRVSLFFQNKEFLIDIEEKQDEFSLISALKSFAYLELRFWKLDFIKALEDYVTTKESSKLRLERTLFSLPKEYVASALSALMDAEGSIDHYRQTRRIRIRMKNENYLEDWKNLLRKFGVESHVSCLRSDKNMKSFVISGWEDFNKINDMGLNLFHSKKRKKMENIFETYKRNQISRNSANSFYVDKLRDIGPIGASDFAIKLGKSKGVVNHYLTRLESKGIISADKSKVKYLYYVPQKPRQASS